MEMIMRILLLIYSITGLCNAYVAYERTSVSERARKKGYACNSSIANLGLMKIHEKKDIVEGYCIEAVCGRRGLIAITGCPTIDVGNSTSCKVKYDMSKHYPQCCSQVECRNNTKKNINRKLVTIYFPSVMTKDIAVIREDTIVIREDTTATRKDTTVTRENTTVTKEDTAGTREDTTVTRKDTTVTREDTTVTVEDTTI